MDQIRDCRTVAQAIDAIGRMRVMRVTRRRSNNVTNWIAAGRFPPEFYLVLQVELQRVNCRARPGLWGIIEPKVQRAA